MNTTAEGERFLSMIPAPDAAQLIDTVDAAFAALPQLQAGVRVILSGMLYRVDSARYYVNFARVQDAPLIVAGGALPEPKRPNRKKAA